MPLRKYTVKGKIVIGIYLLILSIIVLYSGGYVINYISSADPDDLAAEQVVIPSVEPVSNLDMDNTPLSGVPDAQDSEGDNTTGNNEGESGESIDVSDSTAVANHQNNGTYSDEDLKVLKEANITIYFNIQSFEINQSNYDILNSFAKVMKKYPDEQVVIEGHSDGYPNFQNTSLEVSLASDRMDAVKNVFDKEGIDVTKIITVNSGSTDPVSKNSEDHYKNDRIEVYFVDHASKDNHEK